MSNSKKEEELAFNRKYSRFKLQVYFNKRMGITHFGQERYHCTVAQIRFGHVKEVILNREKGLQDCIERLQLCENLYGPYQTALIYDRRKKTVLPDGKVIKDRIIRKYLKGQLVEWEEDPFADGSEKLIITTVKHTTKDNIKFFHLEPVTPILPTIDFKTEIANALNKTNPGDQ
jgi:hypothetical protein